MSSTRKSLAEAAAEVLNASRAGALKAPMPTLPNSGSGLDAVHDLGGATSENPQGNQDIGSRAAAAAPSATPPGSPPAAGTKAPMQKLPAQPAQAPAGEEVDPDEISTGAPGEAHNTHTNEEADIEAARQARWEEIKTQIKAMSVKEDVAAMLAGQNLSEEFAAKVTTIFEAAVLTRAVAVAEQLETQILEDAESAIEEVRAELEEKVDSYLNFVVENWVKENEVAIESGLKTEIVEGFLASLKNVFVENYIDIPEEKVDVLEQTNKKVTELEAKLNEALNQNISLSKQLGATKKTEILNKVCEGLTAVQSEKVKTLAEGVEFSTEADYAKKLTVVRESYFPPSQVKQDEATKVVALTESESPATVEEVSVADPTMDRYVAALDRFKKA